MLRRSQGAGTGRNEIARFSGWSVDFRAHCLIAPDGARIELSASEVRLMHALATRPRRVQSRESLMEDDAGAAAFDRSIDVRISRLRSKLREDPRNPQIIKTVYGAGYMFTPAVEWAYE
jgi:DNA-binding response OmpR family regulator